ncbi:outer membrane beta-barrel protein [Microbacteriaceae bacterium K1510]|nr:outer membrane beta-barrel protein [Microbacteriaceae bacterium K1510]
MVLSSIRWRASLCALIAFAGLAGSAAAADLPGRYPVKAPVAALYDWSGFYVGINGGYAWGSESVGVSASLPAVQSLFLDATGVHSIAGSPKGAMGGGQVGYNWQAGRIVYGLEVDFDLANVSSSQDIGVIVGGPRTFHGDQKLSWLATLRGRLGFTPVERLFVYGTGGLAAGHADATANLTTNAGCTIGACFLGSNSKTLWGWAAGAGVEYAMSRSWSVKAEYLHYDLGSITTTGVVATFPAFGSFDGRTDVRGDIVRVGLNYRFN